MQSIVVFLFLFVLAKNVQGSFDITDLDWSIRPSENFFKFVNGRWINLTTIPLSETQWGTIYTMKYENRYKIKKIFDDLLRNEQVDFFYVSHSIKQKVTDFYLAGLDEQAIERAGIEPLKETLINLQNVQTYQELLTFIFNWYKKMDSGLIFEFDVSADERNTSTYMVNWKQTGIELPDRAYYFLNDSISENIRLNYVQYIDRLLNLSNSILNLTTTTTDAKDILSLESQLAISHRTPSDLRNPELNYNKYDVNQLDQMMPNLDWHQILSVLTIKNQIVLMAQPDYYQLLDKLIVNQPLNVWKNKIRFTILHEMSPYLSADFVQAHFQMFDYLIHGQRKDKIRWMKIIEVIDRHLGDLLGELFVSRYFSFRAKEQTIDLMKNIISVYRKRIQQINWISHSTKTKALKKLEKMNIKIGYPSKWESYEDVFINRSSYFDSLVNIFQHDYRKKMKDLRKPVDREEWIIPPQMVNAFYYPVFNEIIFPAAILQEPFFSSEADDALNYGGIGYVIGHELTHGFDDEGRQYDENGNLHPWWTPEDIKAFNSRTELLIKQYENYQILGTNVNGELTLGENIADLCGIEIAYQAFLRTKQAKEGFVIDGFTPQQRFFLAAARAWRVKTTDEKLLSELKQDPHAPPMFRINGPLSNMIEFYHVFNVTPGDALFREPDDRAKIW